MDVRTRFLDDDEVLASLADAVQMKIRTAIPVALTEDSDGHVVSLQPLVKGTRRLPDGSTDYIDLPVLVNVPIHHASGGGVTITLPHKRGNTGLAIVCDRSLDAWQQQGGNRQQMDARMHNLADAIYVPGIRADPQRLKNVSTESVQMRSDDGKHFSDLHPTKGITHSVEDGKHVVTMNPTEGLKLLADAGKHVMTLHPKNGIGLETTLGLAMKATKGFKLDGDLSVLGGISGNGNIGGKTLSGLLGGLTGGLIVVLVGGAVLALAGAGAGDPATTSQRAVYALASLWRSGP